MCAWIYILIRDSIMKPCFLPFCCRNSLDPQRCGRHQTQKDSLGPVSCDVRSPLTVCPRRRAGSSTDLQFWKSSDPVSQPASTCLKFLDLIIFPLSDTNFFVFRLGARWRDYQCCPLHLSVVIMLSLKVECTHACPGHVCSTELKKELISTFFWPSSAKTVDVLGQHSN